MRCCISVMIVFLWLTLTVTAFAEESSQMATLGSDGVQRIEVLGGSYFFKPRRIIVKVNIPVELKVKKESGFVPHNIAANSPDAGISFDVRLSEEPETIKFTPKKTGIFPMYCSKKLLFFESHREKGMEGDIEVVE